MTHKPKTALPPTPQNFGRTTKSDLLTILADVMRYRRGLGRYNLSRFHDDRRGIAELEAWEEIENRIEKTVAECGVKL